MGPYKEMLYLIDEMTNRTNTIQKDELNEFSLNKKVSSSLSAELGIPDLRSGKLTVRDERVWRVNEKEIDYCWLVNVSRSFVGWCWLFSSKFNESNFRYIKKPEELNEGAIDKLFDESKSRDFKDKIRDLTSYDLFDANRGITSDGVGYKYLIFAPNTEIKISINNPNSENRKAWESEIFNLGVSLGRKPGVFELKEIFE